MTPAAPAQIRIHVLAEPFCKPFVQDSQTLENPPFARSSAWERTVREIRRYTLGETSGRALLISGYRGSGKSTIVSRAIESVQQEMFDAGRSRRPMLVRLHGPDLLPALKTSSDNETVLKQVTIALYRALADEFSDAWSTRMRAGPWLVRFPLIQYSELAAQLRVELDGAPGPALLRAYWARAGLLRSGVLFEGGSASRASQGLLELVAVTSAAQAYRVVTGKIEERQASALNLEQTRSAGIESSFHVKDLFGPLLTLGSGAAVGAGAWPVVGPLGAALFGSAAALLSAVTLNYSSRRARDSTVKQEVTFLPDRTVASLDRMLPLLVERVRAAGLAPVFVVDELDKVDRLFDRMRSLVKHLKHFVTERAFFCFITERNYFDQLTSMSIDGGYPEEYTYFTDRLFASFSVESLHRFLNDAIFVAPGQEQNPSVLKDLQLDAVLFQYLLLRRARLQIFDVRRQLAQMFDGDGAFTLPRGTLQLQVYRFEIAMQVAIELLLRKGELATRLRQDDNFTQIAYDALYYPARVWDRGDRVLKVSDAAILEDLAAHVSDPDSISEADRKLLLRTVHRLVELLHDIRTLALTVKDAKNEGLWDLPQEIIAALPLGYRLLELKDTTSQDIYQWVYSVHGLPYENPNLDIIITPALESEMEFIERMAKHFSEQNFPDLGKLSVDYRILNTSPAWAEVSSALRAVHLARDTRQTTSDLRLQASILSEYAGLLRRSSQSLALGLTFGHRLEEYALLNFALSKEHGSGMVDAFRVLSDDLGLGGSTEEQTLAALKSIQGAPLPGPLELLDLSRVDFWDWAEKMKLKPVLPSTDEMATARSAYWKSTMVRMSSSPQAPQWHEFVARVQGLRVTKWLKYRRDEMSLADWSEILVQSVIGAGSPDVLEFCPASLGVLALARLGFSARIPTLLAGIRRPEFKADLENSRKDFETVFGPIESVAKSFPNERGESVVVLSQTPVSIVQSWQPSRNWACLVLTPIRLQSLLEATQWSRKDLGIATVMVEGTPDSADTLFKDYGGVVTLVGNQQRVFLAAQRIPNASVPVIVHPASVDEAMEQWKRASAPTVS